MIGTPVRAHFKRAMQKIAIAALAVILTVAAVHAPAAPATSSDATASLVSEAASLLDRYRGDSSLLEQADQKLRAALAANPQEAGAYVEQARLFMKSSGLDPSTLARAESALRRALAIDADHANAYVLLGYVLTHAGRLSEAEGAFARGEALRATSPWLLPNRAELREKQGRRDEAAEIYARIAAAPTTDKAIRINAYEKLQTHHELVTRDFDRAEQAYRAQIALEPDSAWARGNYSSFLRKWRLDARNAERLAREALAIMNYGKAREALGFALYLRWAEERGGDAAGAEALFAEAARYVPDVAAIVREVGYYPRPHPILDGLVARGISLDIQPGLPGATTPLSLAAAGNSPELAIRMIELGAHPNTPGYGGATPLLIAAMRGNDPMVRVLLDRGADPTLVPTDGKDAEQRARDGGFMATADMLAAAKRTYVRPAGGLSPDVPFRPGTTYVAKRDIARNGALYFRAGERVVFDARAPDRDPAMLWFNFRDARDRIHEYRIPKARLATWTDDFEEIGPQQRP